MLRKGPPGEGGFEEGDAPYRGLRAAEGVRTDFHIFVSFGDKDTLKAIDNGVIKGTN